MKKGYYFTLFALLASIFYQPIFAQRSTDLAIEVISPLDGDEVVYNNSFYFNFNVANLSGDSIRASDTLRFYLTLNGNPVTFENNGTFPYQEIYNQEIAATETDYIQVPFAFGTTDDSPDTEYEICLKVLPFNAADPIEDPDLTNNEFCYSISVVNTPGLGITEQSQDIMIVSPNPATNVITFSNEPDGNQVRLSTIEGKEIKNEILSNNTLDVSDLANGIYVVRYAIAGEMYSKKIIIRH